ncbi:MAG: DUF2778 domain-containing protein [Limnobacter sp.]|uniref:DUF2778 domain-containing protein n=1 Tax=Limnobacter sp. TaxID=2003368 RepID=UPI003919E1D5
MSKVHCEFKLNGQRLSTLIVRWGEQVLSVPAFSGTGGHLNKRESMCSTGAGPIPIGRYLIVDRQAGGKLGWLYDYLGDKSDWFSLFALDDQIDDSMICAGLQRGQFRLHPAIGQGISRGCVTLPNIADFRTVRRLLQSAGTSEFPGTALKAYGVLVVS